MIDVEAENLQGFCSQKEVNELVRLAEGRLVLEVGVWKGRCTIPMAKVAERVVAVDHFRGDRYTGRANTLPEFRANLERFGVGERVVPVLADFVTCWPLLGLSRCGLLIYDGDHDEGPTRAALGLFGSLLEGEPRVVAVHDYDYPQVRGCVDEFAAEHRLGVRVVDRLAILSGG